MNLKLPFLILTILLTKLFTGESLVPDCNTLDYRRGKKLGFQFRLLKNNDESDRNTWLN